MERRLARLPCATCENPHVDLLHIQPLSCLEICVLIPDATPFEVVTMICTFFIIKMGTSVHVLQQDHYASAV